ncbi:DUF3320 domain-containing protein [Streptomyces sp. NPDC048349]|uniref:DUF3320 domain-containing protein n=1 Tax=Streptomyces sp. NPDC048349 TaxID=3155486 RepID=UPI003429BFC7
MHGPTAHADAAHGSTDPSLEKLRAVLGGWRESLIDLGGRNRLLNFTHTRTLTLEITEPGYEALLGGLGRGWDFAPVRDEAEEEEPGEDEAEEDEAEEDEPGEEERRKAGADGLVTQKRTQGALDSALRQLRQKANQTYNDFGLWVLWLGVGMLRWREEGAHENSSAPLVLVPVELVRDRTGRIRLHRAEGQDALHNPALAVKLAQLGVDWTAVAQTDCLAPDRVLAAARSAAAGQAGWEVCETVVLATFAAHKEAMYQDLKENEAAILDHPLIRAIGLGPESGLPDDLIGFEPPAPDRIDEIQLPEQTPLVLDADASQRQCIAAAMAGRSFVMSGPPGTGKSQTITNMIAGLMHSGRTVLFVSEKAAALDVVRNRLTDVGLGDFVLALHSGDTGKKAVAQELDRALTTEVRASGAAEHELDAARRLREQVSAHAAAMNEERHPLGRSLHHVLGRLARLDQDAVPHLPPTTGAGGSTRTLSAASLAEVLAAARSVARSWRPSAEGEGFAWRGLRDADEAGDGSVATALAEAVDAVQSVRSAAERRPLVSAMPVAQDVREIRRLADELKAGLPARHPDSRSGTRLEDRSAAAEQLAEDFGLDRPGDIAAVLALIELAGLSEAAHRPPAHWFDERQLRNARAAVDEIRAAVAEAHSARAAAQDVFGPQVLEYAELPELVRRFEADHRGLTARLTGQYRADRAAAAALTVDGIWSKAVRERLGEALAWQRGHQRARRLVAEHGALLGPYVPGRDSGFGPALEALANADRIAGLTRGAAHPDRLPQVLAYEASPHPCVLRAEVLRAALADWCDEVERRTGRWAAASASFTAMFDDARRPNLRAALGGTMAEAAEALAVLARDPSGPAQWQAYRSGLSVLAAHGLDDLVPRAAERNIPAEVFPAVVERAVLQLWADTLLASDPRLRTTGAAELDARVGSFREADRMLVAAAAGAVVAACNSRRPRAFGGGGAAVIRREAEKKARHMPVRDLLGRAREVVQAVKPCFMMNPLSVSQYLPADYRFDVVIFDEASQVRPGDAVNCVYRGRSLIVAGDEKQLPPTAFFDAAVGDGGDEYDEDVPDSFESLLHACKAGALRELPLRWHYRSRHEDLITFSNREFYENGLVTFPGATESGPDLGVAFFKADGCYDKGGRRDNRREAEEVARRVLHHFDTRPGRSLGVVALSQAQASTIDECVQQARLARPDLDRCFTEDRLDGFFVKSLESVQGDERDVMIMSVGYGPDERGVLGLGFGPINREGGWRRLNVAVTRARYRVELVASFHGGQLKDSANPSVRYLKRYLEYAENGPAVLSRDAVAADTEPDSPFEESVLRVLRGWGYEVQPQVGVSGYRIDLGLRHPAAPGSYALGIECDGAMYHSSRAARDRDRLRQQVLEGLGWTLHRIWGTDWYRNRAGAESRLKAAVAAATARDPFARPAAPVPAPGAAPVPGSVPAPGAAPVPGSVPAPGAAPAQDPAPGSAPVPVPVPFQAPRPEPVRVRVRGDEVPERDWSRPYEVAVVRVPTGAELHTPEARPALRGALARIVEVEGPIHEDLLVQRAREVWGVKRAGSRIRDNVLLVLRDLVRQRIVVHTGGFADVRGRHLGGARTAVDGAHRKVTHVAPAERQTALAELAAECPGMSLDELMRQGREFFGWKRMGDDIRSALESDVAALVSQGRMRHVDGRISASLREPSG